MDDYDAAEARRAAMAEARAEAYETLERTAHIETERRDYSEPDAMEEWRRGMPKGEPLSDNMTMDRKLTDAESLRTKQWQAYIDNKIESAVETALAKLWPEIAKGTAMSLARIVTELRAETQEQIGSLRADLTIERAANGDNAKVIDLPNPLRDRRAG